MPTVPPVAATRRESAQKNPAFTAGGRRDAEIATPTWKVEIEEYWGGGLNINQAAGIPSQDTEGNSGATWNGHKHPDPKCAQFTFEQLL